MVPYGGGQSWSLAHASVSPSPSLRPAEAMYVGQLSALSSFVHTGSPCDVHGTGGIAMCH